MLRGQELKLLSPSAWVRWEREARMDAQPSSDDVNNGLCLIRKPLGNCSHHSPSSLGRTVCMQLGKALITSTQQYQGYSAERLKQASLQS